MEQQGKIRTVLIVEDDRLLAKAIAATLDLEGLRTVVAHDGEQALTLARAVQPDLILLDAVLPLRSGIEVCAALKTDPQTASTPIVFVTARMDDADRAVALAAGADAYVTKPFSPVRLIDLVKELLAGGQVEPQTYRRDVSVMPADQLVVYARDLKELFQQERAERQALEKALARLAELDRLKTAFITSVTHELMTPFAAVGMALEVLRRRIGDSCPDLNAAVEDLSSRVADLHRVLNGVVKFAELVSKQRDPQPGRIALNEMIPRAIQPLEMLARSREVELGVQMSPRLPFVHADPDLLAEAVFQMVHNAIKFNRPGGQALVKVFEAERCVVIEVADTGVGLDAKRLELLGQPFEQTADALRRGQEGLGIGWSFVRYVAEAHGGWTHVKSPGPGQGSVFSLAIPAAFEQQEERVTEA